MFDIDQETWIYLLIIAVFLAYFLWNSRRTKKLRKNRKNRNFRKRYFEKKHENSNQ
ncbi:hypothetical protein MKO06_00335 [Gramella sp. GC03-9]|uniref:Uncharacterized protein n=1 Tax=Christiangramia oceanisediminis TaxID=2920386 RepID=A0A9X2I0D1_9FLAO|nr:hypothetical protein [Gramella oceanisediminis]MCP9198335.1 hypothetical protein [Gramella oceanisediminis]